jgi:hypothetical protein
MIFGSEPELEGTGAEASDRPVLREWYEREAEHRPPSLSSEGHAQVRVGSAAMSAPFTFGA